MFEPVKKVVLAPGVLEELGEEVAAELVAHLQEQANKGTLQMQARAVITFAADSATCVVCGAPLTVDPEWPDEYECRAQDGCTAYCYYPEDSDFVREIEARSLAMRDILGFAIHAEEEEGEV